MTTDPVAQQRVPGSYRRLRSTGDAQLTREVNAAKKRRYYANLQRRITEGDPFLRHGSLAVRKAGCRCEVCRSKGTG